MHEARIADRYELPLSLPLRTMSPIRSPRTSSSTVAKRRAAHRLLVDAIERRLAQSDRSGSTVRSIALSPAANRNTGTSASTSRSRRSRRVRSSYGMPCSRRNSAMSFGVVVVQMQATGGMLIGRAFEHGADQSRLVMRRRNASLRAPLRAACAAFAAVRRAEQALVFAQRVFDFAVFRQARRRRRCRAARRP